MHAPGRLQNSIFAAWRRNCGRRPSRGWRCLVMAFNARKLTADAAAMQTRREKRVLQLLAARPSYCNWTHRGGAQNRFLAAETHILPPPVPLHQAALLGGACSLTSPMRRLSCRHSVAGGSASFRSTCAWTRSRHGEEKLSVVVQSAPE